MAKRASTYRVCVGNLGEDDFNTLVVDGIDVVIPLEMDLDDDPLQDDEIRLRSLDGFFEQIVRASDPDAEPVPDQRLIYYHFRDVLPGPYLIEVNVGGVWVLVVDGLIVTRTGSMLHGNKLTNERPTLSLGAGLVEDSEEDAADEQASPVSVDELEYMDLNDGFEDS
jgi:hypothetical protein